jgi:hypothetical protein
MPSVQVALTAPALTSVAAVGSCPPDGMAALLLPGAGASLAERAHAVAYASTSPQWAPVRPGRQDTPQQHDLRKFAYKNRIAATGGVAAGPQPAWDPV